MSDIYIPEFVRDGLGMSHATYDDESYLTLWSDGKVEAYTPDDKRVGIFRDAHQAARELERRGFGPARQSGSEGDV